ncbi:PP2C family serine/threonine-protein phosphatase [Sphingopyxis sp. 22461]|uniref:PP2C family serine/threonine-protein phosphatase n=1 Tax=Sphingopyxis sp. 22461 TaxID=3453923 RepID=UPI003F83B20C
MWKWAAASQRGTSHEKLNTKKQDAFRCASAGVDRRYLVALACDGAGSASHGGVGAMLTCRTISQAAKLLLDEQQRLPAAEEIEEWVDATRDQIAAVAERAQLSPRDFATTLVGLVSDGSSTVSFHIGDGAAVVRSAEDGSWQALSWPQHGEYASTTYFVTDDGGAQLRVNQSDVPIDRFALFTDGIERLALNFTATEPHSPFFASMSEPVVKGDRSGFNAALSRQLAAYLSSDTINERTDDDKTLILAALQ